MRTKMTYLFSLLLMFAFQQTVSAAEERYIKVEEGQKNSICMVNDFYNPMADFTDFSVVVDGKTYYGCCAGCKQTLSESDQYRYATYSAHGKKVKVDKATAGCVLADKKKNGTVRYFNNDQECGDFVKNPDAYSFPKSTKQD